MIRLAREVKVLVATDGFTGQLEYPSTEADTISCKNS